MWWWYIIIIYIIYVLTCGERTPGAGEDSPGACRAEEYHRRGEQETELIRSRWFTHQQNTGRECMHKVMPSVVGFGCGCGCTCMGAGSESICMCLIFSYVVGHGGTKGGVVEWRDSVAFASYSGAAACMCNAGFINGCVHSATSIFASLTSCRCEL